MAHHQPVSGDVSAPRRLWNRFFILLSTATFTTAIGQSLLMAALPIYVVKLGSTAAFGGTLTMIFSITALVGRLFIGGLSDQMGRHRIMVMGAALFGLATISFRFTTMLPLDLALPAMALLRLIQGLGFAAVSTTTVAAVVDVTPKDRLAEGIGYYGLGQTVSAAVGPSIALALVGAGLYTTLFDLSGVGLLGTTLLLWFCSYERHPDYCNPPAEARSAQDDLAAPAAPRESFVWRFIDRGAMPAATVHMVMRFGYTASMTFLTLYATSRNIPHAGVYFLLSAGLMFAARLFTGRLYRRFGLLRLLTPTLLLGVTSLLIIAFSHNFYLFCLSGMLNGLSLGIAMPVLNTVALESAPPNRRGAASSTFFIGTDLGIGVSSSFWGVVIDATSFETAFLGGAAFVLATIGVAFLLLRSRQAPLQDATA